MILFLISLFFGSPLFGEPMANLKNDSLPSLAYNAGTESIVPVVEGETDDEKIPTAQSTVAQPSPMPDDAGDAQGLLDQALSLCEQSQSHWSNGDPEKAIECLDQAYTLLLTIDPEKDPKLSQQKEDIRFMISKRILEIYSSRFTAVSGNHDAIPLIMNRYVEQEIRLFQTLERGFFIDSYRRSGRYRGAIVKSLREAGLPEELSWLPLIESGFKVNALSRARALGLWQFIPSTGYKYGLKRDTWIDERMDPEKATVAAIEYLRELHQIFGDWTTVLAGYNCGEGNVLRVIRDQKINYLDNFWDLYEKLPSETARYVPRFLATLHIVRNPAQYGFALDELDVPLAYEQVKIERPVQLAAVAETIGVPFEVLTDLNPELRHHATSDAAYDLKVPLQTGQVLLARLDDLPKWTPPKREFVYHRVKRGETLYSIARKYGTSVPAIIEVNNLSKGKKLKTGQRLKIPARSSNRA